MSSSFPERLVSAQSTSAISLGTQGQVGQVTGECLTRPLLSLPEDVAVLPYDVRHPDRIPVLPGNDVERMLP